MIQLKNRKEIEGIRRSGQLLADLFRHLDEKIAEGMSTYDVDKICDDFIRRHHAIASCLGYMGYDITLDLDGYVSDSTHTYEIGKVSDAVHQLNTVTEKALYNAIDAAGKKGARLHDIAAAVEATCKPYGYGIVRDYCGHGVGFSIHEDPPVFNYVSVRNPNVKLREGLVIAIEPMINMGSWKIMDLDDGWTVKTVDGSVACHWEHTVAITENGAEIMTI